MIQFIVDIRLGVSKKSIVYLDIHDFFDGYPNPVLVL